MKLKAFHNHIFIFRKTFTNEQICRNSFENISLISSYSTTYSKVIKNRDNFGRFQLCFFTRKILKFQSTYLTHRTNTGATIRQIVETGGD